MFLLKVQRLQLYQNVEWKPVYKLCKKYQFYKMRLLYIIQTYSVNAFCCSKILHSFAF